jgi:hypothetical protein
MLLEWKDMMENSSSSTGKEPFDTIITAKTTPFGAPGSHPAGSSIDGFSNILLTGTGHKVRDLHGAIWP